MLRKVGNAGASREQAQALLAAYVAGLERSPREAYQRYSEHLSDFNCAFAASVHNSTSAEQRRHAAEKLAGWEGDLRAIAKSGAAPGGQAEP